MAPKRRLDGDGVAESPGELSKPMDDDTAQSSAKFAKPVYLVAVREDDPAAYSVLEIDAAAVASGDSDDEPPRVRSVAALPIADEPGMSFVAAHSKHGSWIVGVGGGQRARTIIFDPRTLETFQGPRLAYPKHEPILISHGGEVYALTRRPRVVPPIDREPWFESITFNKGVPSRECGVWVHWNILPPPPFFPCLLDPYEFRNPPEISVCSYAVVGSYILVSPQPELAIGTYAFHVVNKTWEKIHGNNLPFVGQALPLEVGGSLFAACPLSNNSISASASVFHMSIKVPSSTPVAEESTSSLIIQEFKVAASDDKIPWPLFCPLGWGSFCFIRLRSSVRRHSHEANCLKRLRVILSTLWIENAEAIITHCQSQGAKANDLLVAVQVKEQIYRSKSKSLRGMAVVTGPLHISI
ncbi:hypothetical protein HU200_055851 [Digitaria exilis]|uniref:Uncharacterized protein n=1 Tax=Digitaria exilis TaxID=1010633 RepID=A0A835AFK0_9POAL|nr:hypothetical protein HU200_055851 [Digitaria exilis]CAB3475900.1 unnamed protein product [Digitaria exilis]